MSGGLISNVEELCFLKKNKYIIKKSTTGNGIKREKEIRKYEILYQILEIALWLSKLHKESSIFIYFCGSG